MVFERIAERIRERRAARLGWNNCYCPPQQCQPNQTNPFSQNVPNPIDTSSGFKPANGKQAIGDELGTLLSNEGNTIDQPGFDTITISTSNLSC